MPEPDEKNTFVGKVKIMLGACPANIDKHGLIESIKLAQDRIKKVLDGGEILRKFGENGGLIPKLRQLNDKLGEVLNVLDDVDKICQDIEALNRIYYAMVYISPDDFRNNPEKTAKAFDEFFLGVGRLCRLTPILKPYQQFFEGFGNFYTPFAKLRARKEGEVYTDKKGGSNYAGE